MRRFDKKNNIINANLLAEQRYLQSKELINENEVSEVETPLDGKQILLSIDVNGDGWSTNIQKKLDVIKIEKFENEYKILCAFSGGEKITFLLTQEALDKLMNGEYLTDPNNQYNYMRLS